MKKPSRAKMGCLVVVSVALILMFIFLVQWLKPIDIAVPPRKYPPDNAYVQLKALGEQFGEAFSKDARLKRGIDLIVDQLKNDAPSLNRQQRADIEYALNRYEPFRRKIVAGLERPSVAVYDYRLDWLFYDSKVVSHPSCTTPNLPVLQERLRRSINRSRKN